MITEHAKCFDRFGVDVPVKFLGIRADMDDIFNLFLG